MVIPESKKTITYTYIPTKEDETLLYSVFLAYIEDIKRIKGITTNKLLKQASLNQNMVYNIKHILSGGKCFKPSITLRLLIKLYVVHGVPFNLSDYVHLIDKKS